MGENDAIVEAAKRWLAEDPDPHTRARTEALIQAEDIEELQACFSTRLQFGTAGIRGALGPGPGRMNQALVRRVTAGLGHYLLDQVDDVKERGVVIGFDGRYKSRDFATDAAAVLGGLGIAVYTYDAVVPTPQLAHATKHLQCAAGIMVTASHNPPQDNGYKVYWGDAAQIIPPHDRGISDCIDRIESLADVKIPSADARRSAGLLRPVKSNVVSRYKEELAGLRVYDGPTDLRIVYTAMHGVGRLLLEEVLESHGYRDRHVVAEQADPDPDFSTVSFPNPEEPGALDLAKALAGQVSADIVIANDPDADRLAVCVPRANGEYLQLSGDQVGALLADELLQHGPAGKTERLVATTVVSSSLLGRIAAHYKVGYAETLTGLKWIAQQALRHRKRGGQFVMGYEEALGYCLDSVVFDKDGISAALVFCDLAAREKAKGRTVIDRLSDIYWRHGLYATRQRAVKLPGEEGKAKIAAVLEKLRTAPPQQIGDAAVVRIRDIQRGENRDLTTGETSPIDLPQSNVLAFELADHSRVVARPSGTEPKIKFYFEVRQEHGADEPLAEVWGRAQAQLDAFIAAFMVLTGL